MDESEVYFRITVGARSLYRKLVAISIFFLYFFAIWIWPYFLPMWFKLGLITLALAFLVFSQLSNKSGEEQVMFLTYDGRMASSQAANAFEASISPSSYILPWCVQLHLVSKVDQTSKWLTLYNDQVDDASIRRLRRTIFRAKQLGS